MRPFWIPCPLNFFLRRFAPIFHFPPNFIIISNFFRHETEITLSLDVLRASLRLRRKKYSGPHSLSPLASRSLHLFPRGVRPFSAETFSFAAAHSFRIRHAFVSSQNLRPLPPPRPPPSSRTRLEIFLGSLRERQ